jgi:hypothetical protein
MKKNYVIYKYCLNLIVGQPVTAYKDLRVLSIQRNEMDVRGDSFCIWAVVDTNSPAHDYHFRILGTGQHIDERYPYYLATFQMIPYVWHLFCDQNIEPVISKHFS